MSSGGSFSTQNKILPGTYINFVAAGNKTEVSGRGIAALALELDWGPENEVFSIDQSDFNAVAKKVFGYDATDKKMFLVREALKKAKKLLIYRLTSGGQKASATISGMLISAKHGGVRGNAIKVAVRTNVDNALSMDVITYLDGEVMDSQTVPKNTGSSLLKPNDFVDFGTVSELSAATATPLSGGTNAVVNAAKHNAALVALEVEQFNTIGYIGTDSSIKALYKAYVKRLRDEGKTITGVLADYPSDNLGLINVKNGVVLATGETVQNHLAVAWVTGATAAAEMNMSLTDTQYEDAIDVDVKYNKSSLETAIKNGEFVFYAENNKAKVLSDINSLTTFLLGVSKDWTSNRVVRVMDNWSDDISAIFNGRYRGSASNIDTVRQLLKADLVSLALSYERMDAITEFNSEDIAISRGDGKRDVEIKSAIQPADSMEKLYVNVIVR